MRQYLYYNIILAYIVQIVDFHLRTYTVCCLIIELIYTYPSTMVRWRRKLKASPWDVPTHNIQHVNFRRI